MDKLKVFFGHSNTAGIKPALTSFLEERAPNAIGNIYTHRFPSGESYCQIHENVRDADVFLVQSLCRPVNDALMDLLTMADAAKRASARRVTAVCPLMGYMRQDRKDKSRVPITGKLVMNQIKAAGVDRILTMDLHSPQAVGFTDLPLDHLYFETVMIQHINRNPNAFKDLVILAPDIGASKRAERYAEALKTGFAIISKTRMSDSEVKFNYLVGDVKGKTVLIVDDMTESASTIIQAAQVARQHGALSVMCVVTHFCGDQETYSKIRKALYEGVIDFFYYSDTVSHPVEFDPKYCPGIVNLTVGRLFADAIVNIHTHTSVSQLF